MITEQELKDFAVTVPYSFEYIRLFVLNLKEEQRNLEFVTKIFNVDGLPLVGQSETKSSNHH